MEVIVSRYKAEPAFVKVTEDDNLILGCSLGECTKFPDERHDEAVYFLKRAREAFPRYDLVLVAVSPLLFGKNVRHVYNKKLSCEQIWSTYKY